VIHAGYRQAGWCSSGPGTVAGGLTSQVGFRHLPLAEALNSVLHAGFGLRHVEEGGDRELPELLALVAER